MVFNSLFQISNEPWFPFQFFTLTKVFEESFLQFRNFKTLPSYPTYKIKQKFCFLAVANLKQKHFTNFYKFFFLLSGDVSLNPGLTQRFPDISSTIWELLKKKGLHFLQININSLLLKKDEIRCIASKTKAAIIGVTQSKPDRTVPNSEVNFPEYDILRCDRDRNSGGVAC